jgi:drug/metabolite transporter (DMT)-like permease
MVAMHPGPLIRSGNPCLEKAPGHCRPGTNTGRGRGALNRADAIAKSDHLMSASDQTTRATPAAPNHWLADQAYVLLCITAMCWAGNAVVGRLAAGHIPPVTFAFVRWSIAFLLLLPFAWKHLVRDWSAIRGRLGVMMLVSTTGVGVFNTLQYWSLEYTTALNTLLFQSAGPLIVAIWSLLLLGVRLTLAQAFGVLLSMCGVAVILMHGDLSALSNISFNKGDLIFLVAMVFFSLYSVLTLKKPAIHALSFAAFTFGAGAACLIPLLIWELMTRPLMVVDAKNLFSIAYFALFPSIIAYLCFNRGVQLIGANRAAPFFHLVPVFGSVMAIVFLGEQPQLFHLVGFALVLTGVYAASRKPSA